MEIATEVTIVIGTLNRPKVVTSLIKQLEVQSKKISLEIIVVDQSSNKNFQELKKYFPRSKSFKLYHFDTPDTVAYLNYGWQNAKSPIVLYLDDDVSLTENTITAHIAAYQDLKINGVAGRVINDDEKISKDSRVGKISWFGAKIFKNFSFENKTTVDFPYGCNMSFRKDVLNQFGGFDKKLAPPIYSYNEIDLGYRISKKYPESIVFLPEALVYHHKFVRGGTRNNFPSKEIFNSNQFNYGYFLGKNFNWLENIICSIRRLPYQIFKEPIAISHIIQGFIKSKRANVLTFQRFNVPTFQRSNVPTILLFAVVLLLIFLRFYRAGDFFSFNFDEEYQASLAFEQLKNFHVIWIGVSASNIGFYLGPGFTYLNALLFKLTGGDPISLAYFAPLAGVITGLSIYFVASEIFNKKVAYLATIFYLGSSLINFYDRRFWNPLPIPFITIWLFYSLYKVQKDSRYFILTAFLLASSLHVHLALLVFWPLVIYYVIKNIKKISWQTWLISIGLYLIIVSPLIVFDFVHNFDDLLTPVRYLMNKNIEHQKITIASIKGHFDVWVASLSRYWYLKPVTNIQDEQCLGQQCFITPGKIWLSLISLVSIGYLIFKSLKNRNYRYLLTMTLLSMIFFVFYPGYSAEYYLLNFFVLFPIILGLFFENFPNWLTMIIVAIFVVFNSLTIVNSTQYRFGLTLKKDGIKKVMRVVGDKSYSLENYGGDPRKYHAYGGWRFLFRVYGKKPLQSFADEFFGWIFPDELSNEKPVYRVIVSEDFEHKSKEKPLLKFKEGAYYFYVFKY